MNKRIVLIDANETPNYLSWVGVSEFKNQVYTLQILDGMPEDKRKEVLALGEGDAALLVGAEPFKYLRDFYHYGVRGENYYDCSHLYRLSIEGGAFVKVLVDGNDLSNPGINDFLSPNFTKPVVFDNFTQKVIKDWDEAMKFMSWCDSLSLDQDFGYDYEGSGMPLDEWYEISGLSIATETLSAFISLTDIRHRIGGDSDKYKALLGTIGKWLIKRMDHIWTYNMQYEYQVSHRMLGVDAYNLCDTSVINTIEGYHLKNYSLKWTGQRILGVNTWDIEFDRISDLIDSMLFTEEGKLKKDKHKVLKVDQSNFEQTPEWKELIQRYPQYEEEFKTLLLEYWGNAFMCIPSDILGYYCNLDAFYTLMIYKKKEKEYSRDCWNVNLDNIRLGCRLMSSGLYIDEPYRAKYRDYCKEQMLWGIVYCAQARCYYKMKKHQEKMADIKKYPAPSIKLLESNMFYNGDSLEIVKNLMVQNIDTLATTDTGLNEGAIAMKFGAEFANNFISLVKDAMVEVKMKTPIDASIVRKKKILGIIAEKVKPLLGLDKIKIGPKHIELEKYLYYERAYNELRKLCKTQLLDITQIPWRIKAFGRMWDLKDAGDKEKKEDDLIEFISDSYFKCKSPEENDEIVYDLTKLFPHYTAFVTALGECIQQLPETTKFYSSRGITNITDGFLEFMDAWKICFETGVNKSTIYPDKIFQKALEHFKSPKTSKKVTKTKTTTTYSCSDKVKETWTDFYGFNTQTTFFPSYADQEIEYGKQFEPEDYEGDTFFFMRKMTLNYLLYKKYSKLLTTYVGDDGMFKKGNRYVIEGPDHIPLRYAKPGEPGAIEKCFVKYEVQKKSSKRWSSAFHTIISHGDCKDVLCPPPAWDKNGDMIYGGSDQLLTYFDISSAEVKSAGGDAVYSGNIIKY